MNIEIAWLFFSFLFVFVCMPTWFFIAGEDDLIVYVGVYVIFLYSTLFLH